MPVEFPSIFLLPAHLEDAQEYELRDKIKTVTGNIYAAEVVVGNIQYAERAMFELRRLGVSTKITRDAREPKGREIWVVRLAWIIDSLQNGELMPMDPYALCRAYVPSIQSDACGTEALSQVTIAHHAMSSQSSASPADNSEVEKTKKLSGQRDEEAVCLTHQSRAGSIKLRPRFERQSTSDYEAYCAPASVYAQSSYSCQRPTPLSSPNSAFLDELKSIRLLRTLREDKIGIRAYSTSIAAIAAYPSVVETETDIAKLPGCGPKMAQLFREWQLYGHTVETSAALRDAKTAVLKQFYNIWGVGASTARRFYAQGWRDLDDIVEYGWNTLNRIQQIGVKYYDDFKLLIPRAEAELIGGTILGHANQVHDGMQLEIVGSYRRGKPESGDVDVVLSHKDENKTLHLVEELVSRLEAAGYITFTLNISTANSKRGQVPVAWMGEGGSQRDSGGFDTLDKAMVVWHDANNDMPCPYRRVDIIISPWKTVGCAVLGWSGDNTFQRDLRRYCKAEKGLKFDSSGIRSRRLGGAWVDLETSQRPAVTMEDGERRVFAGLGLEWLPPSKRCTG